MNEFIMYLRQGVFHILDTNGLDHFYFVCSFSLLYSFEKWRAIFGLITAFTLGHCSTLILSALEIVSINIDLVETLIPITILMSCFYNYWAIIINKKPNQKRIFTYVTLVFFGLIHGLGFSNFLKMMLFQGDAITFPLLGFNLGIEIAQLIIVFLCLSVIKLLIMLKIQQKSIQLLLNSAILVLVILMMC